MYCWLQCYYSIPHRAALLNTSWQLQKQVSQDHPELDCANVQLRINLASMSLSLLNSSHCFYSACPISCLISPGIILTPVGWAGDSHQSKNCWVFFCCTECYFCVVYWYSFIYPLSGRLLPWKVLQGFLYFQHPYCQHPFPGPLNQSLKCAFSYCANAQ